MRGFDFHRQKPLDNFIVDFFSNELMLAIEIDGVSHKEKYKADLERQKKLENLGISFLRFTDFEVIKDMNQVFKVIECWIDEYEKKKK